MKKQTKVRDMTEIERDAVEPLSQRRQALLTQMQALQADLDFVDVALNGMAVIMHAKYGDDLGIDLDEFTLYKTKK